MSHDAEDGADRPATGSQTRIRWRACGRDRRDRRGLVGGREELQIAAPHGTGDYSIRFHHVEVARLPTLEQAKARAGRDLELWREQRRMLRERDAAEAARQLRDRRAREERLAAIVERLNAAGIAARELFGAVTLTDEAAERVLGSITGAAGEG